MARKSQDLKRIETRRSDIADRMSVLETELEKLRSEDLDLAIAARVLERLAIAQALDSPLEAPVEDWEKTDVQADASIERTLTIGDMALKVLEEAPEGLTSNDILEALRARWLPALMRTSLSPPLSRLKHRERIRLDGDRWKIVSVDTVTDDPFA